MDAPGWASGLDSRSVNKVFYRVDVRR